MKKSEAKWRVDSKAVAQKMGKRLDFLAAGGDNRVFTDLQQSMALKLCRAAQFQYESRVYHATLSDLPACYARH